MPFPLVLAGALGGAGLGLLKSELIDRPREQRDRDMASITTRYSPWTGLRAGPVREADPLGNALQYGTTGAMMASGYQNQESEKKLSDILAKYYAKKGLIDMEETSQENIPLAQPFDEEPIPLAY